MAVSLIFQLRYLKPRTNKMVKVLNNIRLSDYSSYKIGGSAKYFVEISSKDKLLNILNNPEVFKLLHHQNEFLVLGGGTNILFDDSGFDGLVIRNKIEKIEIVNEDNNEVKVSAGAGVLIEDLLKFCIEHSLSGLEWAGGLPGTLGGAVRGNAGAFGGEIKDVVDEIKSINLKTFEEKNRKNKDCKFGYRTSIFKTEENDEIIIEAVLNLKKGDRGEIEEVINEKISYRQERHPSLSEFPNLGSTFKNIPIEKVPQKVIDEFKDKIKTDPFPVLPSVKLLAGAGMTGERVGDIEVSSIHPNYLVNLGEGKSKDAKALINKIKKRVYEKYGVELEEEITILN